MLGNRSLSIATISAVSSIDNVVWVTKARLLGSFGVKVAASSAVSIARTTPAQKPRGEQSTSFRSGLAAIERSRDRITPHRRARERSVGNELGLVSGAVKPL